MKKKNNEKNIFYIDNQFIMMIETNDEKVKNFIKEMNRKRKNKNMENIAMYRYKNKEGEQIKQDIEKKVVWKMVKCSVHHLVYFLNIAEMMGAKWVEIAVAKDEKPIMIGFLRKINNKENKKLKTVGWIAPNMENEQVL
jgi:hypothetical protein